MELGGVAADRERHDRIIGERAIAGPAIGEPDVHRVAGQPACRRRDSRAHRQPGPAGEPAGDVVGGTTNARLGGLAAVPGRGGNVRHDDDRVAAVEVHDRLGDPGQQEIARQVQRVGPARGDRVGGRRPEGRDVYVPVANSPPQVPSSGGHAAAITEGDARRGVRSAVGLSLRWPAASRMTTAATKVAALVRRDVLMPPDRPPRSRSATPAW